jgi:hypothetical protein
VHFLRLAGNRFGELSAVRLAPKAALLDVSHIAVSCPFPRITQSTIVLRDSCVLSLDVLWIAFAVLAGGLLAALLLTWAARRYGHYSVSLRQRQRLVKSRDDGHAPHILCFKLLFAYLNPR